MSVLYICIIHVSILQDVLSKMSYMFELTQHRPSYWGPREAKRQSCKERKLNDEYVCWTFISI